MASSNIWFFENFVELKAQKVSLSLISVNLSGLRPWRSQSSIYTVSLCDLTQALASGSKDRVKSLSARLKNLKDLRSRILKMPRINLSRTDSMSLNSLSAVFNIIQTNRPFDLDIYLLRIFGMLIFMTLDSLAWSMRDKDIVHVKDVFNFQASERINF